MPCSAATGSGVSELLDRYGISRFCLGFSDVLLTFLFLCRLGWDYCYCF